MHLFLLKNRNDAFIFTYSKCYGQLLKSSTVFLFLTTVNIYISFKWLNLWWQKNNPVPQKIISKSFIWNLMENYIYERNGASTTIGFSIEKINFKMLGLNWISKLFLLSCRIISCYCDSKYPFSYTLMSLV